MGSYGQVMGIAFRSNVRARYIVHTNRSARLVSSVAFLSLAPCNDPPDLVVASRPPGATSMANIRERAKQTPGKSTKYRGECNLRFNVVIQLP